MEKKFNINPNLYTPIAIVLAGIAIAVAVYVSSVHTQTAPAAANLGAQPSIPSAINAAEVNSKGDATIGDANAPLTMAYWYDYQCPFCQQNDENTISQVVKDYVQTGKMRIVFKDFAFLGPDSDTLGHVARAVWEVNPSKFYAWHKAVFDNQGQEGSGWATADKIRSITASVLSASETTRVMQLMQSNAAKYKTAMESDKADGNKVGVSGTPAMLIGSQMISGAQPYAQVKAVIDSELAKKK